MAERKATLGALGRFFESPIKSERRYKRKNRAEELYEELMGSSYWTLKNDAKPFTWGNTMEQVRDKFEYISRTERERFSMTGDERKLMENLFPKAFRGVGQDVSEDFMRFIAQKRGITSREDIARDKLDFQGKKLAETTLKRKFDQYNKDRKITLDLNNWLIGLSSELIAFYMEDPTQSATFKRLISAAGIKYEQDPNTGAWRSFREKLPFAPPRQQLGTAVTPQPQVLGTPPTQRVGEVTPGAAGQAISPQDITPQEATPQAATPEDIWWGNKTTEERRIFMNIDNQIKTEQQQIIPPGGQETGITAPGGPIAQDLTQPQGFQQGIQQGIQPPGAQQPQLTGAQTSMMFPRMKSKDRLETMLLRMRAR